MRTDVLSGFESSPIRGLEVSYHLSSFFKKIASEQLFCPISLHDEPHVLTTGPRYGDGEPRGLEAQKACLP